MRLPCSLLLLTALLPAAAFGREEDEADAGPGVRIEAAAQALAALIIEPAPRPEPAPAATAWAEVLDPAPLLEAAIAWRQRQQAIAAARSRVDILERRRQRLNRLRDSVRRREREQAALDWQAARAELARLELAQAQQQRQLRLAWGEVLSGWVVRDAPELQRLAHRQLTLVRLTPAADAARFRHNGRTVPLPLLSPDPRVDSRSGQRASLHRADLPLPIGLRFTAAAGQGRPAIPLPDSAVVWQGGRPWFYVRIDGESFRRRPLRGRRRGGRWWVETGLAPGEAVVIRGAQWLLAQELRALVPEEDDD
ncbi:membrane fusion protein, multidrug efflux system [Methylomarinovum caldicuralii]|uniref:Membrane fusion protein, multidrug efflux system n=1 Tax=Methylomarinovum caldicuralii TaxID=438856 RepID=A0AAU9CG59_9GAMM|nr:hypothetical protein [Methylomarinovum caldicuralii]BCX81965.1 membrane fusion protein, multidrug efflux system [Methylomarinovum caldicuralii]